MLLHTSLTLANGGAHEHSSGRCRVSASFDDGVLPSVCFMGATFEGHSSLGVAEVLTRLMLLNTQCFVKFIMLRLPLSL